MSAAALVDIGINLAHDSYDRDRAAVISRAHAAGVLQMVITGATIPGTRAAIALARAAPARMRSTAGVHPHHASELDAESARALEQLALEPEVAAVGECGIDYFRDLCPRDVQRAAFTAQLDLAARIGKPVFLHQRDGHEDFVAIVREFRSRLAGGVAHCFTGGLRELRDCLDLGLHIGVTGWICDERRGAPLREAISYVPAGWLMIETDGPYLLPRDLTPKPASRRNEPMYLPHIAAVVARARREDFAALAGHTSATARKFFGLPPVEESDELR
jgi:TatD DNase family protein